MTAMVFRRNLTDGPNACLFWHYPINMFAASMTTIYKIIDRDEWDAARACGRYAGSRDDKRDGFIHFSTRDQLCGTAARHFSGQSNLTLLAIDGAQLGQALKWEASRAGALFPHLYAVLPVSSVVRQWPLPLDDAGVHKFPDDLT